MRNILIPTDFTENSLIAAEMAAGLYEEKVNIIMFHVFDLPDSLQEVVIRNSMNAHGSLVTDKLRLRCRKISLACTNISNISFRFMYGTSLNVLRRFVEVNQPDLIYIPGDYRFVPVIRESIDPTPLLYRLDTPLLRDITRLAAIQDRTAADRC